MISLFQRSLRVLVAATHPHDVLFACGGSLSRLSREFHVEARFLFWPFAPASQSCSSSSPTQAYTLVADKEPFSSLFLPRSVQHALVFATFAPRPLQEMLEVLQNEIAAFQPDIILTHCLEDDDEARDSACLAARAAARSFSGTLLFFEAPRQTQTFKPSLFFELSKQDLAAKVRALNTCARQLGTPCMSVQDVVARARFWPARLCCGDESLVEAFEVGRQFVRLGTNGVGLLPRRSPGATALQEPRNSRQCAREVPGQGLQGAPG